MIDFHSHIIPGIDDGSKNLEETIQMIEEAKKVGFTDIISTSHYINNYYETNQNDRINYLSQIQSKVNSINLIIGSEIYVTQDIVMLIKQQMASTINNTRYALFELPMNNNILELKNIIYSLLENKYVPIIAHPERYSYVKENPNWLIEYIEMGVLFQSNFGSIIGLYGKEAQKTVELLLKNNMIHFLGSDVHRKNSIYTKIPEILKRLERIISKEKIQELTTINPKLVLEDRKLEIDEPIKIKKGFLGKFK